MTKQTVYLIIAVFLGLSINLPVLANRVNTFIDNGNGSVSDIATGLVWQQQDDDVTRNHADAITYCQDLSLAGSSNWRLPNVKELLSIVDYRADRPSIDDTIFLGTNFGNNTQFYWSATSPGDNLANACFVGFDDGLSLCNVPKNTDGLLFVRCVR